LQQHLASYYLPQVIYSKTNKYLQPTPAMSVIYTKVAFQVTPTLVVTQTTEDTHTLPATAIPTTVTIPTIMATGATPSITIITIITIITPTNVNMSDYNGGVIEAFPSSPFECPFQGCGQCFASQSELIAHMDRESADARKED
jgi:hypothetical protein